MTANDRAVAPRHSCRELDEVMEATGTCRRGEATASAQFHFEFHIEAFRKMDGVRLLNDCINISLTRLAGQLFISEDRLLVVNNQQTGLSM